MPNFHRKLRLEKLEDRCLLTAVAQQFGDTLTITGTDNPFDDFDQNELVIVRQRDEDRFKVLGDVAGQPLIFDNVDRLEVALGTGTDQLILNRRQIKEGLDRGVAIDMGAGSDGIRIKGLGVAGLVEILRDEPGGDVSSSPEVITILDSRFVGGTNISTGNGADQVRIANNSRLRAFLNIDTGDSDTEDSNDFVFLGGSEFGRVTVDMSGGDNDELDVFGSNFNARASFDGGAGDNDAADIGFNGNAFFFGADVVNFEIVN
jgi:hypothetical protein